MHYSTLATLVALTTLGSTSPMQPEPEVKNWQVSDFHAASSHGNPTFYHLLISGEGESNVSCLAANNVTSHKCPGAKAPAPFSTHPCGNGKDTYFSWQLGETGSPLANGGKIFYVRFVYDKPGSKVLYGCSQAFSANDTKCTRPKGETLEVPTSFSVQPSNNSQCIYE